jgi:hypothetical protein
MEKTEKRIQNIFDLKGLITPIAEKSHRNLTLKTKSNTNTDFRLYHFAVGHAFKNVDKEVLFDTSRDEKTGELIVERFKNVYSKENFSEIRESLQELVSNTRNIYAHYVHDFSKMKTKCYAELIPFLIEAFEIACIFSYIKEKEISLKEYFEEKKEKKDKDLVLFLKEKFFPFNDKRKEDTLTENEKAKRKEYITLRDAFGKLHKKEAIEQLLFINLEEKIEWKINNTHKVFDIEKNIYFSHYAHLFILSMFLYKNEAENLISKISGFKKNDDNTKKSKRNIFTFFSKKFSSQDIDSEENNLIKFRDIIQYLNKYPVAWNKALEQNQNEVSTMTEPLKQKIYDFEILNAYPKLKDGRNAGRDDDRFILFVKNQLGLKKIKNQNLDFTNEERNEFSYEINTNKQIQDNEWKIQQYEKEKKTKFYEKDVKRLEYEIRKCRNKIKKIKNEGKENENTKTEKLKKRIAEEKLISSNGRNQDRFMDFACRFLAENHYFGENARFKSYKFYDEEQQKEYLEKESQKVKDQLKYYQGKEVDFFSYQEIKENFPADYSPFVIQNNAIQIKLETGEYFSVQRNLMVYFLEHALFLDTIENKGKDLIEKYLKEYQDKFKQHLEAIKIADTFEKTDKTTYLKFFPKRLLHNYCPADYSKNEINKPVHSPFQKILDEANLADKRYKDLKVEVKTKSQKLKNKEIENNLVEEFDKKNKGKQYKLRFLKKAWHLMYFKEAYKTTFEAVGHHKSNHITKEEFNDFCKYVFAFGEVTDYKIQLIDLLQKKNFYTPQLQAVFEKSGSIEHLFNYTKTAFENWLKNSASAKKTVSLNGYRYLTDDKWGEKPDMIYINASLFIDFLKRENYLKTEIINGEERIIYQSLKNNNQYLIPEFYYQEKIDVKKEKNYKSIKPLFNKLRTNRLEDCLLYEIAMHYLKIEKGLQKSAKESVNKILSSDCTFEIKDFNDEHLYNFSLPFAKLEAFTEIIKFKEEQQNDPKNRKTSYLAKLKDYLEKNKEDKALKPVHTEFEKLTALNYDGFNKINNHILAASCNFTDVYMKFESYLISKHTIEIIKDNRIDFEEITDITTYIKPLIRKKAFHIGLPEKTYFEILTEIEKEFLQKEIKTKITDWKNYDCLKRNILQGFMEQIHEKEVYDQKIKESKKRNEKAIEKYLQIINKSLT